MTQSTSGFSVSADTVPTPQTSQALAVIGNAVSPFNDPASWDSITIGGSGQTPYTLNGVKIQFKGAHRHFSWQNKKGPGTRGDVNTFRGTHTNPFQLIIWVWTDAQWDALQVFLSAFNYNDNTIDPATGEPNVAPVDMFHPALSFLNISQVYCERIETPEIDQDRTGWVKVVIHLHEFLLPVAKNVTATPSTSAGSIVVLNRAGGSTGATIATQQQAIQDLAPSLPTTLK